MENSNRFGAATTLWLTAFVAGAVQMSAFWLVSGQSEILGWVPIVLLSCVDAALLFLPYPFLRPRWRWTVLIPSALLTLFLIANLWYVRTFLDLMPMRAWSMVDHTGGFVTDGIVDAAEWSDLWLWLPPLVPATWWVAARRRIASGAPYGRKARWLTVGAVAAMFLAGQAYNLHRNHARVDRENHRFRHDSLTYVKRLGSQFTRLACADYYGWPIYVVHELLATCGAIGNPDAASQADVDQFLSDQRIDPDEPLTQYLAQRNSRKNLILIIAESLNSDAVGRKIGGRSVTPRLDSIAANDTAIVLFRHMCSQTRDGRSSDGQLIYNTGLLPLRSESAAYHYGRNDYPSLAKALGGYSFEVIPEPAEWWNHHWTTRSYGFDTLASDFLAREPDFLRVDPMMMSHAIETMKRAPGRFYCQLTTIATHDPYTRYADVATPISEATEALDPRLRGYLNTVCISDSQIGDFIEELRRNGLYDNSVVVIASDHNAREHCLPDNYPPDIFLLMLNTGVDLRSDRTVGQIDVFPTLLQVLGLTDYHWHGLGRSLLQAPEVTSAVDGFGRLHGVATDSVARRQEKAWKVSEHIVKTLGANR